MAEDRRVVVGYALLPKKQQSFIQDSLLSLCKSKGVDLVKIDQDRRLTDQGPFDCVLHKLDGEHWRKQLEEFRTQNPSSTIIDSPASIERLHNRISMLQVVSELKIESETDTFGIPKQIVIYDKETLFDRQSWEFLKYPVVAKPLIADGSAKSHKMALVFNREGLNKLKPPIVLQEFVNHGGVIFKVYVVGEFVKCVKRKSLPDVSEEKLESLEGSLSFSQVSNLTSDERNDDKYYKLLDLEDTELPPLSFITDIARGLRRGLKLNLFNFDVIRDARIGNRKCWSEEKEKEKDGIDKRQLVCNCDVEVRKITINNLLNMYILSTTALELGGTLIPLISRIAELWMGYRFLQMIEIADNLALTSKPIDDDELSNIIHNNVDPDDLVALLLNVEMRLKVQQIPSLEGNPTAMYAPKASHNNNHG
ncbi:hypothetical protein SADUNF_Sadunf01G0114200 [Salix dunnii]|uniref:Inositol-tetrakisphosphate 1-kinase 1 n=1 Tax=Salix dunnii TaxID=1413687 RepID=A0A835NBA1_9ROSI|nr:hypothetical protein SADUNF_Sadunf01G0114200 [Salix dunnii]